MPEVAEVERLLDRDGVYVVTSPMCKFNMKMENPDHEMLHVRKETRWATNSRFLAEELRGECENKLAGVEIHRRTHLVGGNRAKAAKEYPKELVRAVLRGLKKDLRSRKAINALEELLTGPSPDDHVETEEVEQQEFQKFVDDVTGTELPEKLVREARAEELSWLRKERVYERVPMRLCEEKGVKPLQLKWLDINKGDSSCMKVRSRLVTKEIRKAKKPEEQLRQEETFAATPPVECVMLMLSLFMTGKKKGKKLGVWDISRAHFMGQAQREIFVLLPEEDLWHEGNEEPMVGLLRRSM